LLSGCGIDGLTASFRKDFRANMARILVTTSAWNSALTCVESLSTKGHAVDALTWLRDTPLNFSRHLNQCIYAPEENEAAAWTARLIEVLCSTKYDLLIPMSDLAVNMVSNARAEIEERVGLVMAAPQSIAIASDKALSTQLAMRLGVPVPASRFPQNAAEMEIAIGELGLPAVVKVPISTGSQGVRVSSDIDELLAFSALHEDPANRAFCQGFVGGDLVGATALADKGRVVASHSFEVATQYLVGGNPPYAQEFVDPLLDEYVAALIKELDWTGPIDFDFLRAEDGSCVFLEINPRFSGTISFARAVGIDFPALLFDLSQGRKVEYAEPGVSGRLYRSGLEVELRWWRQDPRQRTKTLLSHWFRRDVLSNSRLSDPGLLLAQALYAFRH